MLDQPKFIEPAMTIEEMKRQETELADNRKPSVFKLRGQMLSQGRTDSMLAATDDLTLRLKVYASGGENELHAHPTEDHAFIVLQGSALFYGPDGEIVELGANEGMMMPAGNFYKFNATSEQPLVLLRIGGPNHKKQKPPYRINIKGEEMRGDSKENKKVEVIFKDGEFFG